MGADAVLGVFVNLEYIILPYFPLSFKLKPQSLKNNINSTRFSVNTIIIHSRKDNTQENRIHNILKNP